MGWFGYRDCNEPREHDPPLRAKEQPRSSRGRSALKPKLRGCVTAWAPHTPPKPPELPLPEGNLTPLGFAELVG